MRVGQVYRLFGPLGLSLGRGLSHSLPRLFAHTSSCSRYITQRQITNVQKTLRFGVLCSHPTHLKDFQKKTIERLLEDRRISLELVIVDERKYNDKSNFWTKLERVKQSLVVSGIYNTLNRVIWDIYKALFVSAKSRETVHMQEFENVDKLFCNVKEEGFSEYFYDGDIDIIEEYQLDFMIRFGFGIIRGKILDVCTYGVWSYHHDDERKYRGTPPCFWEMYYNDNITGAVLQRLTESLDRGVVLKRGFFKTSVWSYSHNVDNVFYGSVTFAKQVAMDIINGRGSYVNGDASTSDAKVYKSPSLLELLVYLFVTTKTFLLKVFELPTSWKIGLVDFSIDKVMNTKIGSRDISWHEYDDNTLYMADPFVANINSQNIIFFEEMDYVKNRGKISFLNMEDLLRHVDTKTAYEPCLHVSYPYILSHEGETYCIPESAQSGTVDLFKVESPKNWKKICTLIDDVSAVDPTIVEYNGTFWLFFTNAQYHDSMLCLWYADSLMGDWKPHKNNPVKVDIRSSRPAGTPFRSNGTLYRPAQKCDKKYGEAIIINRVDNISVDDYAEQPVRTIDSGMMPGVDGVHTLASGGGKIMVDGRFKTLNPFAFLRKIRRDTPFL